MLLQREDVPAGYPELRAFQKVPVITFRRPGLEAVNHLELTGDPQPIRPLVNPLRQIISACRPSSDTPLAGSLRGHYKAGVGFHLFTNYGLVAAFVVRI